MFKRLKDKIVEEVRHAPALRFPAGSTTPSQDVLSADNLPSRNTSSEQLTPLVQHKTANEGAEPNLIDLEEGANSNLFTDKKPVKFTIADDDDEIGGAGDQGQVIMNSNDAGKSSKSVSATQRHNDISRKDSGTPFSGDFFLWYSQPQGPSYVPQSDIESEVDEYATPKLDGITKEELYAGFQKLRARLTKYKAKYGEVVKAFKDVKSEKDKISQILSENQDRALRRISELKEQCQLEQQAKAHLEDNLRVMLDEKEQMIHVLETKVRLLKEGNQIDVENTLETGSTTSSQQSIDRDELEVLDAQAQQDKVKRLEELLTRCKAALRGNKERTALLTQENASLLQQLESKSDEIRSIQEKEAEVQAQLRDEMRQLKDQLELVKHQQEESVMSMAETKRNMHEELENRERQLTKANDEVKSLASQKESLENEVTQLHEKAVDLEKKLEVMEKTMEEEKQALMQELSRGKAAAISLIREECEKKVLSVQEEIAQKVKAVTEEEAKAKEALEEKVNEIKKIIEENSLLKKKVEHSTSEVDQLQEKLSAEQENFQLQIQKLNEEHEKKIATFEEEKFIIQDTVTKEAEEKYKQSLQEFQQLVQEKEKVIFDLQENIKSLSHQLQENSDKLSNKEKLVADLSEKCDILESQINKTNISLKEKETAHQKELEDLCNQLSQNQDQLKIIISERDHLMSQIESANHNVAAMEDAKQKCEASSAAIDNLNVQIENLAAERDNLQKNSRELEAKANDLENRIYQMEKEKDSLSEKLKSVEGQFDILQQNCTELETAKQDLLNKNEHLEQQCNAFWQNEQVSKEVLMSVKSENEQLAKSKEAKEKENEQLRSKLNEMQDLTDKLRQDWCQEKTELSKTINDLKENNETAKKQNEELLKQMQLLQNQADAKEASLEIKWQEMLSEKQERVDNLSNEKKNLEMELNELREKVQEFDHEKHNLQGKYEKMVAEYEQRIAEMEKELTSKLLQVSNESEHSKSELESCSNVIKSLENVKEHLLRKIEELETSLQKSSKEYEENLLIERNKFLEELNKLMQNEEKHKQELDELRRKLEETCSTNKELEEVRNALNSSNTYINELENNLHIAKKEIEGLSEDKKILLDQCEKENEARRSKEDEIIKAYEQKLAGLRQEMDAAVMQLKQQLDNQNENHKDEINKLATDMLAKHTRELKSLEETLFSSNNEKTEDLNREITALQNRYANVLNDFEQCKQMLNAKEEELSRKKSEFEKTQEEMLNAKKELEMCIKSHKQETEELQKELKESKNIVQSVNDLQDKLLLAERALQEAQSKFRDDLQNTEDQAKERLEIVKQRLITKIKRMQESHKKKIAECENLLQLERDERQKLEEELKNLREMLKDRVPTKQRLEELEMVHDDLRKKNMELQNSLEEKLKFVDDASILLKAKEEEVASFEDQIRVLQLEQEQLSDELNELKSEMYVKDNSLEELNVQLNSLKVEHNNDVEILKHNHQLELIELENRLREESKTKFGDLKKKADQKLMQIKQVQAEKEEIITLLQDQLNDLETSNKELKKEKEELMQQLELEQESAKSLAKQIHLREEILARTAVAVASSHATESEQSNSTESPDQGPRASLHKDDKKCVDVATQDDMISNEHIVIKEKDLEHEADLAALREEIDHLVTQHKREVEELNTELEVRTHQLDESLLVAEANQSSALQQLLQVRQEVEEIQSKLVKVEAERNQHKADLERLMAEKEVKQESQKQIVNLEKQVEDLQEITLKDGREPIVATASVEEMTTSNEKAKLERQVLVESSAENRVQGPSDATAAKIGELQKQIQALKEENCDLVSKLQLAGLCSYDEENSIVKKLQKEWENKLAEKEEEANDKLKQIVRSFSSQLESKESELEQSLEEAIEKSRREEEKLIWEHRKELVSLEMELAEKNAALEDVHEYYQQQLQEKNEHLKRLTLQLNDVIVSQENANHNQNEIVEEAWSPEQQVTPTPTTITGSDGLKQIANTSSHYSEQYMPDPSLPEPTEFEYLRNILFEYMMGKEPLTLAKVIAAVLRFSEDQTHQILQKEEARQFLQKSWLSSGRT